MSQEIHDDLKSLVQEYLVSLELDQHTQVSKLGSKICARLVELFESELNGDKNDRIGSLDVILSPEWQYLNKICQLINERSRVASSYEKVSHFVRIHDLVWLRNLLGSVGATGNNTEAIIKASDQEMAPAVDIGESMAVLRHSMNLLRPTRPNWVDPFWFDQAKVARLPEVGFPIYRLNLCDRLNVIKANPIDLPADELGVDRSSKLFAYLGSPWFQQFSTRALLAPYPVDRFTLMVAIWLVGHQCGHHQLESLMSELVDAVQHQEAHTCNEEELLQLSQLGSVWLTYRRRYCAMQFSDLSLASAARNPHWAERGEENAYNNNDSNDEDSASFDDDMSFSGDNKSQLNSSIGEQDSLVAKLRHLIDSELVSPDSKCLLCGHERQLSAGGGALDVQRCPNCQYDSWQECCAISQKSLQLASLSSLVLSKTSIKSVLLVQPAEWLRALVTLRQPISSIASEGDQQRRKRQQASERVDISENFQRLTLIRSDDEDEDGQDKNKEDNETDGSPVGSNQSDGSMEQEKQRPAFSYKQVLTNFMASRLVLASKPTSARASKRTSPSESLQMLRFVNGYHDGQPETLLVNALDLLLSDQMQLSPSSEPCEPVELCLRLSATASRIWVCSSRSELAQLPLGCGRKFDSLELIKLTGAMLGSSDRPACPHCCSRLFEVASLSR